MIRRNPCRIKGAGQEKSAERPTLTIPQVYALADAVEQRYRALILLAMFTSLRWGELAALRRCDIDLAARTVRVTRQLTEVNGSGLVLGPPKSAAGKRVVTIPGVITPVIQWHLSCFADDANEVLIFTSPEGKALRHSNFRRRVWLAAMIYLHGSDARQHEIADSLSKLAREELKRGQQADGGRAAIGHATGTRPETRLVKIISESG